MGFDVARAALEAFHSRLPFLDRLVSYLHFADLAVLEQSTWDEFGHGVTVMGRRGPDRAGQGVILAAPLPRASTLAGLDPGSPDVGRAGTLLALAWAIASLEDSDLRMPVTLVAARPDPVGAGLRSVLDDRLTSGQQVIAAAPTGPKGTAPGCAVLVLSVETRVPILPLRAPLRDVVTLASCGQASGRGAATALSSLAAAIRDGSLEPLEMHPAPGIHLGEPELIRLTVGLRTSDPQVPEGWRIEGHPGSVGSTGSALDRFVALAASLAQATSEVAEAWTRAGQPAPRDAFRIADLGSIDPSTTLLALALPREAATPEALAALVSRMSAIAGVRSSVAHIFVPARGGDGPIDGPGLLDTASCLLGQVQHVTALGPRPGDLADDPPARIREWGVLYRDALRAALSRSSSRRSP